MASCDTQTLLTAAKCFVGLPSRHLDMVIAQLLCNILQNANPMASCDVDVLMQQAKCFLRADDRQIKAIQTQLLCEILNGGGTGTTCLLCGDGPPTEDAPCDCSIYYSTPPNAGVWVWDSVGAAWEEVISPGP